jgi:hypothetical protein
MYVCAVVPILFLFKYVLNSLKKLLETVDTPRLMMQIAKTICQLSKFYPDSTFNIFQVGSLSTQIINIFYTFRIIYLFLLLVLLLLV